MDAWKIRDLIITGVIKFNINDVVILFRRKGKNPKNIEYDQDYVVISIDMDFLLVESISKQVFKIHKTYVVPKYYIRNMKIDKIIFNI